jgi:hypothetical protein
MFYQAIKNGKLVVDAGLLEGFVPPAALGWGLKTDLPKAIWNLRGRLKELNLIGVQVHVRATISPPAFMGNFFLTLMQLFLITLWVLNNSAATAVRTSCLYSSFKYRWQKASAFELMLANLLRIESGMRSDFPFRTMLITGE